MEDVFDQTFDVFNFEIDNVASDFTDFIVALKGEIQFNVIEENVETFSVLVQNYTDDIKPTMDNASNSVDNINNNILPGIQTACASQGDLCKGFNISKVNKVLGKKFYQNPLPNLPDDIQTNLADLNFTLTNVTDVDIIVCLG